METSLQRTFSGAKGTTNAISVLHHNSKPETAEKCAALKQQLKAAEGAGLCSVMAYGNFGLGLIDLKGHLKQVKVHGKFQSIVRAEFDIGTTWRTQLMFLGEHLSDVKPAIAWATAKGLFKGTEYSVSRVNSLMKVYLKRGELEENSEAAPSPERTEMRWPDVLRVIDWAKTSVKDTKYDLDQMAGLLREWEAGGEKTGSSAKSVKRDSYSKKDIIKALVLTSNIANLVFRNNQQLRERIVVLESGLERERATRAPTAPEPRVQDAILLPETTPEALITGDGGSAPPC